MVTGTSSIVPVIRERSTIDGTEADGGPSEVGPSDDLGGSRKPDPPTF